MLDESLIFIKLGGSLITDKNTPNTARPDLIHALVSAIKRARHENPELKIILGHGSGSFGHTAGDKFKTRGGVYTLEEWDGFHQVWQAAHALNQIVLDHCFWTGLPVISFPPSASVHTKDHEINAWELAPIKAALATDLVPLVYGDVTFDTNIGGTILSTEELFAYLAPIFQPGRILLAGIEPGVWADYPVCQQILPQITSSTNLSLALQGSASVDVTGGMRSKVALILSLARHIPGLQTRIFSGQTPDDLFHAILGAPLGTLITN